MSGSARDAILSRIRHANGARPRDEARQRVVDERLTEAPKGVIPARGQLNTEGRIALFRQMAEKASATVAAVGSYAEVPSAVAFWLRQNNFPTTLKMSADPRLAAADFGATALTVLSGASNGDDLNALSHADAGIAETGTLMLTSGPENPTSLNFLPENHIVVLAAKDIEGDMERCWEKLRDRHGKGVMPRSVNFVTGPSRSADIEQTLLLGAHGPRALHIILVG
ncbi:MAG: lactate utilization protein [Rhizobiaceae bacterium]|nr:lactate utilization protein [Rhizobiaceae bacterium]